MDEPDLAPEPVTLAESLVALQAQSAQGTVVVTLDGLTTRIYLRDGAPVAVRTDETGGPTGNADVVWESLVGCLQWVEPTIAFEADDPLPEQAAGDPCQVEPLILEAVRRQFDLQELDAAVGPFMAHRPRVLDDTAAIAERCGLYGADEQNYLAMASRARTVEDLLVDGPLDLLEAYQLLYGLVLLGAVSLQDPGEPWDGPEIDPLAEEPLDAFDDEPIDAFDEDSVKDDGRESAPSLSPEVADAFEPGLAEFLLDVVQESEPPPAPDAPPTETAAEEDAFPPLEPDESLPPPPLDDGGQADGFEGDFPPLPHLEPPTGGGPDDSLPPPPPPEPAPRVASPRAEAHPSREELMRQADEDAQRILAEARAKAPRTSQPRSPAAPPKPPRDPARPARNRRPSPAPRREPRPSSPRTAPVERRHPQAPTPPPTGRRVIIEQRVNTTAGDSRVPVRTSIKPVATSARPRPVVTRRKRAFPSNPNQPAAAAPTSPPRTSRRSPPAPLSPVPSTAPPTERNVTPPDRRSAPAGRSSQPRDSNPTIPSHSGPPSRPGRRAAESPPPTSSGGADDTAGTERQKQLAQLHLKKGKRFLYRSNAVRALPELDKALELDPDSVELQLFALWARFTVDPGDAVAAKATERELRTLAGKAMSDDRKFGFAHFVMGQLALREGRNDDAARALGAAVKLDPDNQDAKRGYQIAKRRATK
ncbi:MAG TPA: DUF4388 domain-containing protein [Polyangiaceae bacterium]|nr:DUF4388 domain-containing protein [Polyangiaceae bacterium]